MEDFGKYRLKRRLAFGGMAEIFLAELRLEENFRKPVVLKRILPNFSRDPGFVQMFIYEAVLAARFNHPQVVQIYDFGQIDGAYFIAMEYIDGCDLREVLRAYQASGNKLSPVEVAYLGELCGDALGYVHSFCDDMGKPLSIVHRDVSPANLMLTRQGQLKLMDFGIARCATRQSLTASGVVKGKLAYLSPEQARAEPLDGASDQFALGLVLLECLQGSKVYQAESESEMLALAMAGEIKVSEHTRDSTEEKLLAILCKTMDLHKENRFPDCKSLANALRTFRLSQPGGAEVDIKSLLESIQLRSETLEEPPPALGTQPIAQDATAPTELMVPRQQGQGAGGDMAPIEGKARSLWPGLALLLLFALVILGIKSLPSEPVAQTEQKDLVSSTLYIETRPADAEVWVDGVLTDLRTPGEITFPMGGSKRLLELRREGFSSDKRWLSFEQAYFRLVVDLQKNSLKKEPPPLKRSAPKIQQKALPPQAKGYLSLRTQGAWAEVYHKGKLLGVTPLNKVALPAGKIELELKNPVAGLRREVVLELEEGQHTLHSEKML